MTDLITTDLAPVPSRTAPSTYSSRMDTWLGKISAWTTEANALATGANTNATTATTQAGIATTQVGLAEDQVALATTQVGLAEDQVTLATTQAGLAASSAASAIASPGTSATSTTSLTVSVASKTLTIQTGKSLVVGMSVKIAHTTTPTTWMHGTITSYTSGTGELIVNVTAINGSGTQSAWTVSLSAPGSTSLGANVFTGQQTFTETKDTTYVITDGTAFEIDPANGNIQTITLGADRTPAATNFEAGQSIILGIDDGTDYTITWTNVIDVWVVPEGTAEAPTLATTGYTWVGIWKVGSVMYGSKVGQP